MNFSSFVISASSLGVLVSHILIVLFGISLLFRMKIGYRVSYLLSRHAFTFAFAVALLGVIGSLLYSEGIGFEPCLLCWLGRVFLYPQAIILGIALYRRDNSIVPYILGLSIPGAIISLYHAYTNLGGTSITECTSVGGACSKVYVLEYGYITIPMMAFTSFLLIIISMLVRRAYVEKDLV